MEVKVGDVKLIKGEPLTVISIADDDGWITVVDSCGFFGVCREQDFGDEEDMESKPSDLEIVMKALCSSEARLDTYKSGRWVIEFPWHDNEESGNGEGALLTWAKQTIGID